MRSGGLWDAILLTVGDMRQKRLCEQLIADTPFLAQQQIFVLSDDAHGCRIGSGGAVLCALEQFAAYKKLLIVNAGGMSKRSVHYAVKSKAFAAVRYGQEDMFFLELLLRKCAPLAQQITQGVLICCSDIFIETQDLTVDFSDNVGFGTRVDYETGSRHGVMFADGGVLTQYLHKRSPEELRQVSRMYGETDVLADTGIVFFSRTFVSALCKAVREYHLTERICREKIEVNLYPDIVSLLSRQIDRTAYLQTDAQSAEHVALRESLFEALRGFSMHVCVPEEQRFIHLGSLYEAAENIRRLAQTDTVLMHSVLQCSAGHGNIYENVILGENCTPGENSFISDIHLQAAVLPAESAVCGVKLRDGGCVAVCCPIRENPKTVVDGCTLWEQKRFYRGVTFDDSYAKLLAGADEPKWSLAQIIEQADFDYPRKWLQFMREYSACPPSSAYREKRREVLDAYFEDMQVLRTFRPICDRAEIRLPVRVNFSGTWTDALPYCTQHGGEVLNMAVCVENTLPIHVTAETLAEPIIEFVSDDKVLRTDLRSACAADTVDSDDFILHRAVLRTMGFCTQTNLCSGFRLTTAVTGLMHGSGLGTSSILLAGCFRVLGQLAGIEYSNEDILSMTFIAESVMQTGGGWQDPVGGLYAGVSLSTSESGLRQSVHVQSVPLRAEFAERLGKRLAIVSTGQRHFGRFVVTDVMNRYLAGVPETVQALEELKALNRKTAACFQEEDIAGIADCLNTQWTLLQKLSDRISSTHIEKIVRVCRTIADGVCICGAGAGGYLLLVLREDTDETVLNEFSRKEVFQNIPEPVKRISPYKVGV